jgi:hypothetical protein
MVETLVKNSDFLWQKSKFFLNRVVTYFPFLLIPYWAEEIQKLNLISQVFLIIFYLLFMVSQWYLLGKELDHRLKIYYRTNSSLDRIVYRLLLGLSLSILLLNIIALFPDSIRTYLFWGYFTIIGIFYSWPTRGKIIEESVATQFEEYKYLDSFEKNVLYLSIVLVICSIPEIPIFQNIEALKLFFDPKERVNSQLWEFMNILYLPFNGVTKLYNLSWCVHFYFFGITFYLLTLYSILRFFISRRLSILGAFAFISSWSVFTILEKDFFASISSLFPIIWIWSNLWVTKSSTYRSGFLIGMINYLGVVLNTNYILLLPIQLILQYFIFNQDKTLWYRKQILKYSILGCVLTIFTFLFISKTDVRILLNTDYELLLNLKQIIQKKGFYFLSLIGVIFLIGVLFKQQFKLFSFFQIDRNRFNELIISIIIIFILGIFFDSTFIRDFTLFFPLVLFSLIPLEWIFQSITRLRSKRNLIFVLYILVCLLDSHLDSRMRIFVKNFIEEETINYIE